MGESTMDITPPLRKVSIAVKNKGLDNLISVLGFYDLKKWKDPYEFLSLTDATTLKFLGDGAHQNHVIETYGYEVQKCTYKLTARIRHPRPARQIRIRIPPLRR